MGLDALLRHEVLNETVALERLACNTITDAFGRRSPIQKPSG